MADLTTWLDGLRAKVAQAVAPKTPAPAALPPGPAGAAQDPKLAAFLAQAAALVQAHAQTPGQASPAGAPPVSSALADLLKQIYASGRFTPSPQVQQSLQQGADAVGITRGVLDVIKAGVGLGRDIVKLQQEAQAHSTPPADAHAAPPPVVDPIAAGEVAEDIIADATMTLPGAAAAAGLAEGIAGGAAKGVDLSHIPYVNFSEGGSFLA